MLSKDEIADQRDYVQALPPMSRKILATAQERKKLPAGLLRETILRAEAALLEDFHSSCERIFGGIGLGMNGHLPEGDEWHRTLLRRMTLDVPGVRPPVLPTPTHAWLDELRRFRHAVRHLVDDSIDESKLDEHGMRLEAGAPILQEELSRFLDAMGDTLRKAGG